MKIVGIAATVLLFLAFPVQAEDLPRFNIAAFCAANGAEFGGQKACKREEETSRGEIKVRWASFAKQLKHFCVQSVLFKKKTQRSYMTLATCLEVKRASPSTS